MQDYKTSYVAFLDVLGFGALVEASARDEESARNDFERLYYAIERAHKEISDEDDPSICITHFSDSFIVSAPVESDRFQIFKFCNLIAKLNDIFLSEKMLLRGGITLGKIVHSKKIAFGPGVNRAYELESKIAKFPRIVFDPIIFKTLHDIRGNFKQEFRGVAIDSDNVVIIDPLILRKAWYVEPGWLRAIQDTIIAMPESGSAGEKRTWLTERYNKRIARFSLIEFEKRWKEYSSDPDANNFVLMDEELILSNARSLKQLPA